MRIMRVLPEVETWLDAEAESWSPISDAEYVALVQRWRAIFLPLILAGTPSAQGNRAMQAIGERLPEDVCLFSEVQVQELANIGGQGAAGYKAVKLRMIRRELANQF